jgi:hypothetical protein
MFVKGLIESHFKGSFVQAVLDTLPKLSSYGHGKGLAMCIGDFPLTMTEVNQITNAVTAEPSDLARGFIDSFATGAMRKVRTQDSRLHGKLTKGD